MTPLEADFATLTRSLHEVFYGNQTKPDGDRVVALQARYALALANVAEFLTRNGCSKDVGDRFVELASVILEQRHGITADAVRRGKAGSDPPDGLATWARRANVVAGLECILKSKKMNNNEAAKYIAKKYPVFDRLKRHPNCFLVTSILSWRRNINNGKVPAIESIRAHQIKVLAGDPSADAMFARGERLLVEAAEETMKAAP